jgi:hypothetical protein
VDDPIDEINADENDDGVDIENVLPVEGTTTDEKVMDKTITTTRSGRVSRRQKYLDDSVSYEANINSTWNNTIFDSMNPITMAASSDPDVMYYHQILRELDKQ